MKSPSRLKLFDAVDATWAPLAFHNHEGWLIREGAGGGQRVSAATLLAGTKNAKVSSAANKMLSIGQNPLFMIKESDLDLDAELEAMDYAVVDPVAILTAPTDSLLQRQPMLAHHIDSLIAPDNAATKIWANGGIDQNRLNVMQRVKCPKTILSAGDMGVAFAAAHADIAMVHAVEVANNHRRKGIANALMFEAFRWAKDQNCNWVSVLTVRKNLAANKLYEALGMTEAAAYHYRSYVSH
jgi:GNAT superfamily N-acetyltransferase